MATRRKANTVHAAGLVQGIVLSPPGSQHVFNLAGPLLLGPLFDIGALIMMLGGMMELLIGINAEGKSLEAVTRPSPRPTSRPLRWTGRPSMDGMWAGPLRSVRHAGRIGLQARELEEVRMAIVGGLGIHRRQITYDWIDTDTGQARHGRIQPATRVELRAWLARLAGQQADFAFEATTGWRYVAEEVMGAGFRAHLAEPADTRALRGPSGAPRPTGPTPATCVTCCCAGRCPSPGSRRPRR